MVEARKTVTVLFADVAGSTSLGESLDPEVVRRVMERFFDEARSAIERHGGTVEKFAGDAVMAVFGMPTVHEDDAMRAVRAASEMRERLASLNVELEGERGVVLALRTGVNTGEVVAGDHTGRDFYATGDAVNVAARLEQSAAPDEILLGEATYRLVRDSVHAEAVEPLTVKGKSSAVPAYRLEFVEEGAVLARPFDSPFVGRSQELARLRGAFERVVAERTPLLVTVLGSAGIGKSRLTAELVSSLDERVMVLEGRCLSYGEGITFWPLQEIVRSVSERPADLPDPEQVHSTEEIFWAYRKLFERLAAERPLVLVLEDIHWAEPTLLEFLEHVIEWTRDVPLLLLCLARPDLLDERPGWPGERVDLEPLAEVEVESLLSGLTEDLAADECARISEAAEGNPLFVEQMVALALGENGRDAEVPPTIHALLAARIDRLDADERALFERAAVVGREFWRGALLELSPLGTEVSAILQRLVRRRLITPERSSFPGEEDAFRFTHLLVQEAGYAAIPKQRRADLHERFAGWLQRSSSPYDEIVGYHLEQAYRYRAELGPLGDPERELASRGGAALARAGLAARHRGNMAGAVNLLSRALELLPADASDRGELLLALGDSLRPLGEWKEAAAVFEDALAVGEAAGERGLAWEATLQRSWVEQVMSPGMRSNEQYLREAEQAVAELEALDHERGLAQAWLAVARSRLWLGRSAAAAEAAERAAAFAHRAGDWHLERGSLNWLGVALYAGPTPASEGIRRCEEILARTDDIGLRSFMRASLSRLHTMLGHVGEARRLNELALADAEELGHKLQIAAIEHLSFADIETLEPVEAERRLRRSLALREEIGDRGVRSTVAALLARALLAQSRYDEAESYAALSASLAAPDDYDSQASIRAVRARVLARRGDFEPAESLAREAVAIADRTDDIDYRAWFRVDLAEVLSLAAKAGEARSALEEAVLLADQKEDLVLVERARTRLAELEASQR
ncbi:MAG TPA: adenylate/guanylate cyclase domain-containing protein [Gaiellaceae bacterium]|nr:adenylate/guanylate cyclase domain-containing protein [Gaiellaceae bacterium]